MGGIAGLFALAGAVILGIITYLFDAFAWNGLINAHGIGMAVAYGILLLLAIVFTIAMIYVIIIVLIIGIVMAAD